jgi:hypothetical protein
MAYDAATGTADLLGGQFNDSSRHCGGTWAWG